MNDNPEGAARKQTTPLKTLAVVLHGWKLGPNSMEDVKKTVKETYGSDVSICAPRLAYADRFKSVRATWMVKDTLRAIDECVAVHQPQRIVLIGHSFGATVARRVFLVASGNPTNFCPEPDLAEEKPRGWASKVERIVLLAAFNRGWKISDRMSWYYSILLNVVGFLGQVWPGEWSPTIFDFRLGAPFMVQTRLHWMAYRRAHLAELRKSTDDIHRPILIQMIGTQDDLISPFDQVDISVDGTGRALVSGQDDLVQKAGGERDDERDYFLVETPLTDHETAVVLYGDRAANARRQLFREAVTQDRRGLHALAFEPALLADEIAVVDETVEDAVFVIHGIRDDGFWTHRIAERVRSVAMNTRHWAFRSWTPTYGYFAMLSFMLPWIRREKVEWFMDQYVSAFAQYPNADFHYVGHSNGTYLAARALEDYPAFHLKHVLFAGSVVKTDFAWRTMIDHARVHRFQNIVASADWVVAWLPKSVDWWWRFDLGGAGFDGFRDAGKSNAIHELKYVNGSHGAGIIEQHWDQIAGFIVDGTALSPTGSDLYARKRSFLIASIGMTRIVVPLLIAIFGVLVPLSCLFLHVPWSWTFEWSATRLLILVLYLALLRFVVTRF